MQCPRHPEPVATEGWHTWPYIVGMTSLLGTKPAAVTGLSDDVLLQLSGTVHQLAISSQSLQLQNSCVGLFWHY